MIQKDLAMFGVNFKIALSKTSKWFLLFCSITLIIGILSANYYCQKIKNENKLDLEQKIALELNKISINVQDAIHRYEYGLQALRAAVQTVGFSDFKYQNHLTYFKSRDYHKEFPGARGFGVIKKISKKQLPEFLAQANAERSKPFELKQLDSPQDLLFIIQYIEPEEFNLQAIGLDIGSESNRRFAAITSAASGFAQLTGPITLMQADEQKLHGFLLLLPIFSNNDQHTLLGWVFSPLLINEILDVVADNNVHFKIEIADSYLNESTLFYAGDIDTTTKSAFKISKTNSIYGRQWNISITPTNDFIHSLNYRDPTQVYFQIIALTFIALVFVFFLTQLIARRIEIIKQKLSYETVVKNASESIIGVDAYFAILHWNASADHLFQFTQKNAQHKPLINWLSLFINHDKLIAIYKQVARGEQITNMAFSHMGIESTSDKFLLLNFIPMVRAGTFIGATISISDITAIKTLQTQLENHNKQLESKVTEQTQLLEQKSNFQKSVLNSSQNAIIATDKEGVITLFTQSAALLLGFEEAQVIAKKNIMSLISSDKSTLKQDTFKLWVDKTTDSTCPSLCFFQTKDGLDIPVSITISDILDEHSELSGYLIVADNLTEKKSLEHHISLVNAALDNSQDMLLWLDESGHLLHSNPYACVLLEYTQNNFNQQNIHTLLKFEQGENWAHLKQKIIKTQRLSCERNFLKATGTTIPMLISASVLTIDKKTIIYFAAKNITERLKEEAELKLALHQADAASKIKTDFIANMSHELRTPLNAINGLLQILELSKLTQEQLSTLDSAKAEVIGLNQTINDIMDLTSVERGELILEEQDFNLDELLNTIGTQLNTLADDKPIEIHFSLTEDLPLAMHGDANKLKQILWNIASNAVKFSLKGEVVLSFSVTISNRNSFWLNIAISDTGIGVNQDKLEQIFDLFTQVDNSNTRQYGGLGIGLTIASQLVKLMGGSIKVCSQLDAGSTFSCSVLMQPAKSYVPTKLTNPHLLNILIVDDNPTSLNILANTVHLLGCNATLAQSPEKGLALFKAALAKKPIFDLVLLDWKMPDIDGWQLAEQIRQCTTDEYLPLLIMVSAHGRQLLAQKNNQSNQLLNGFLSKPVTRVMLLDAISDAIAAAQHTSLKTKLISHQQPLLNKRILLVEDNPTNQLIAKTLLDSQGANTVIANGGRQALTELDNSLLPFDLILMDIQMPDIDGYETTQLIRANTKYGNLPILAITANVMENDKKKCLASGMNGHIAKPFQLEELIQHIVAATLPPSEVEPLAAAKTIDHNIDESVMLFCQKNAINIKQSLYLFNFSIPLYIKTISLFLDDLTHYKTVLNQPTEQLSHKEIKLIFHTLKSTAESLGFTDLGAFAKEIENQLNGEDEPDQLLVSQQLHTFKSLNEQALQAIPTLLQLLDPNSIKQAIVNHVTEQKINPHAFALLVEEVRTFNMRAIDSFQKISTPLRAVSNELCDELATNLNKLKFKEAKIILEQLRILIKGLH